MGDRRFEDTESRTNQPSTLETEMPSDLSCFGAGRARATVIALFPEIPADIEGRYCLSYEHFGKRGAADFHDR
jgi:hypothetical protein